MTCAVKMFPYIHGCVHIKLVSYVTVTWCITSLRLYIAYVLIDIIYKAEVKLPVLANKL